MPRFCLFPLLHDAPRRGRFRRRFTKRYDRKGQDHVTAADQAAAVRPQRRRGLRRKGGGDRQCRRHRRHDVDRSPHRPRGRGDLGHRAGHPARARTSSSRRAARSTRRPSALASSPASTARTSCRRCRWPSRSRPGTPRVRPAGPRRARAHRPHRGQAHRPRRRRRPPASPAP